MRKVSLVSLGCPKNLVDSEGMVSSLLSRGYEFTPDPVDADLAIINTCGFLSAARKESIETIREIGRLKDKSLQGLLVTGCMVGNYRSELLREVPEVDDLLDFSDYGRLPEIVDRLLGTQEAPATIITDPGRHVQARLTPAHYAYLKISEGCNHTCSFCVIPSIRGPMRSVPRAELISRATRLVNLGAREINVIAQDSTMYGSDIYGAWELPSLLQGLANIEKLAWIRLFYAYPGEVTDEVMAVLAGENAVLPYLDVPVQHSSEQMLEAMGRRTSAACVEKMLVSLREKVPGIAIRTTLIVGFPGETDKDFEHLLDFVKRHRFERLGAFTYSPEAGSAAHDLPNAVPQSVADERYRQLMITQAEISLAANKGKIGQTIEVLVDDPRPIEKSGVVARSAFDGPEVDGRVYIDGVGVDLKAGDMVDVRITRADAYDLHAELI